MIDAATAPTFHAFFAEHADYVYRSLRYVGVRPADVEDLAQDVFLVVHRGWETYEPRAPRAWLFAIARRVARDHRRRASVRREHTVLVSEPVSVAPLPDARTESLLALERLLGCVQGLDEDKREVFLLFEVEELPMHEIAEALGIPVQTGFSRLRAAREHVRCAFGKDQP